MFRENRRSASSQAVACVCSTVYVKSILGVGPKVRNPSKIPSGGRSGSEAFTIDFVSELKV
jgi:hypothetical protein